MVFRPEEDPASGSIFPVTNPNPNGIGMPRLVEFKDAGGRTFYGDRTQPTAEGDQIGADETLGEFTFTSGDAAADWRLAPEQGHGPVPRR